MKIDLDMASGVASADGLREEDKGTVRELMDTWRKTRPRNMLRERYYLGT